MLVEKASSADADAIFELTSFYAEQEVLLHRPLDRICRNIREFFVCRMADEVSGCAALQVFGEKLAEVRSLAVKENMKRKGIGRALVQACLNEARRLGVERVFVLTYETDFFSRQGFTKTDKSELPQKIWSDCVVCSRFPDCDEEAMIVNIGSSNV